MSSVVLLNLGLALAQGGLSLETRTRALLLICMIILLGFIAIFTTVSLMFGWRKHIERQRLLARKLREKHGDADDAPDAWTLAAQRGVSDDASGDEPDEPGGDSEGGPGGDDDDDGGDDPTPTPPPLPPGGGTVPREPTGDEDLIDIEAAPPSFDLGLADTGYNDPYDDDEDEEDRLGEEWKQGTHYQFTPDPMDDIDAGDDEDDPYEDDETER